MESHGGKNITGQFSFSIFNKDLFFFDIYKRGDDVQ